MVCFSVSAFGALFTAPYPLCSCIAPPVAAYGCRFFSVGFTVPRTCAAGVLLPTFPSHSGCAVPPRVPFLSLWVPLPGTSSCSFGFVLPIICASTCPPRLPPVLLWLLPVFVRARRVSVLAPALRFTHASVVRFPVLPRSASIFSGVQPLPVLRFPAAVLLCALLLPVVLPAVPFLPLRSSSISFAVQPICSPHHFVPSHS